MTVVYTAIYNGYDNAPEIIGAHRDIRHVLITDGTVDCGRWTKRIQQLPLTPQLSARRVKILSHVYWPGQEVTIWHGGNVKLRGDLEELISLADKSGIAILKHEQRQCAYAEAKACIRWKLDDPDKISAQMAWYDLQGFPKDYGLSMAFLIVRKNTKQIRELNEMWWKEVRNNSVRDQLSFDYCCWKLGITPTVIPGGIYQGPYHERSGLHKGN